MEFEVTAKYFNGRISVDFEKIIFAFLKESHR